MFDNQLRFRVENQTFSRAEKCQSRDWISHVDRSLLSLGTQYRHSARSKLTWRVLDQPTVKRRQSGKTLHFHRLLPWNLLQPPEAVEARLVGQNLATGMLYLCTPRGKGSLPSVILESFT